MATPLVLGHRGAPKSRPENTIESFRAAVAQGADGVELDVRQCATGELVVCHDPDLLRTAGAPVRVRGSSPWALARYDLGSGARVPTLAATLRAIPGAFVNVEVKSDDGDAVSLAEAVVELLIAREFATTNVLVSSFDPAVLLTLRRRAPRIRRGLLVPPDPLEAADVLARGRDVAPWAMHPHHTACSTERVRSWRSCGLAVFAWTVDQPEELVRLASLGVTGVISNVPDVARQALDSAGT